jgi:hypothetical protein
LDGEFLPDLLPEAAVIMLSLPSGNGQSRGFVFWCWEWCRELIFRAIKKRLRILRNPLILLMAGTTKDRHKVPPQAGNSRPSRIHMRDVPTNFSMNALRFLDFISFSRFIAEDLSANFS